MKKNIRPYFGSTIFELEDFVKKHSEDKKQLSQILDELSYRKVQRAKALKTKVENILSIKNCTITPPPKKSPAKCRVVKKPNRNNSPYMSGRERAAQHIREAEALSHELGGTDKDVKSYFFSLAKEKLLLVLDEYEQKYGTDARDYAEKTMTKWSSGKTKMSGLVAERLFNLLPPLMPLDAKYDLTTSLWEHVCPTSTKTFYISPTSNINEVISIVQSHLEAVAINYKIPDGMQKRFDWLSQGDVQVKQQLLNHIENQNKIILTKNLKTQLSILTNHLSTTKEEGINTSYISQSLKIGKHEVKVIINNTVEGITEIAPKRIVNYTETKTDYSWLWWFVGIVAVLWLLNK